MLSMFILVFGCKPEVYQVQSMYFENAVLSNCLRQFLTIAYQNIVKFEIIENVSGLVCGLKH